MMKLTDKNIREKNFHNKLQSKKKGRFENIFYKAIHNSIDDFYNFIKSNSGDLHILDYGCGNGNSLKKVVEYNPKKISGIDISEVSIQKAKDFFHNKKFNLDLSVDNCEQTKFKENTFDLVYGTGILHHLDMSLCLREIDRILKPNGKLLFIEPLGTNPFINFYRKLTPKSRSDDEHPLLNYDFNLIQSKFKNVKIKYYGFLTLIFFPLYSDPQNSMVFKILKKMDQHLFKKSFFKNLAWSVMITAQKN